MRRAALVRAGLAEPAGAERRARREVNLTTVLVALILTGGALGAAWLAVALDQSHQGLDVRAMLVPHVAPKLWAQGAGFLAGLAAVVRLVQKLGGVQRLLGRDVPAALGAGAAAVAAQAEHNRQVLAELAAQRALLERIAPQVAAEAGEHALVQQLVGLLEVETGRHATVEVTGDAVVGGPDFDELLRPRPDDHAPPAPLPQRRHRR